ncbi:MAG: hypothetical protein GYB67_09955 [Chloroflexi bacterium]|nr:hypothetical protein [Chloroflexota bacterium]
MANIELSALLQMHRDFISVRKTIDALRAQTAKDRLELVLVMPAGKRDLIPADAFEGLAAVQCVEIEHSFKLEEGWAVGIERATGPLVVLCEDHSYPHPGWAAGLIDAHKRGYPAVSPAIDNANPATAVSWANFMLTFIHWFGITEVAEMEFTAAHNSAYNRTMLLEHYGDSLPYWLAHEHSLSDDMQTRGYRIVVAPDAVTEHVNVSVFNAYLVHSYAGGRIYGTGRAAAWSLATKLVRAVAAPLVPWVRVVRILRMLDTPEKRRKAKVGRSLPMALMGLHFHAFGEVMGYLFGKGRASEIYLPAEIHRAQLVRPNEQIAIMGLE